MLNYSMHNIPSDSIILGHHQASERILQFLVIQNQISAKENQMQDTEKHHFIGSFLTHSELCN